MAAQSHQPRIDGDRAKVDRDGTHPGPDRRPYDSDRRLAGAPDVAPTRHASRATFSEETSIDVSPESIACRLGDPNIVILDVRRREAYETWHIDGSHNIDVYDRIHAGDVAGLADAIDALPTEKEIFVICVAGNTSRPVARFLREHGYDTRSVTGGMRSWGRLHQAFPVPGVDGIVQIVRPGTGCLSYLVADAGRALVVDPSQFTDEYLAVAAERDLRIVGVVDTHSHADHVSGGPTLAAACGVPYYCPAPDRGALAGATPIGEGTELRVGERVLEVLHTPGHTPSSVSLYRRARADSSDVGVLLTGDTLFCHSVGRPDLADADEAAVRAASGDLFASIERLAAFPDDTVILPGHIGDETGRPVAMPLGFVKAANPLLAVADRDAFVRRVAAGLRERPANYRRIKAINAGHMPTPDDVADLECGPNNCAVS